MSLSTKLLKQNLIDNYRFVFYYDKTIDDFVDEYDNIVKFGKDKTIVLFNRDKNIVKIYDKNRNIINLKDYEESNINYYKSLIERK